jgi:hypothetical protein
MTTINDLLSTIKRRIEGARQMISEQKDRIAAMKAVGFDTAFAELALRALSVMFAGRWKRLRIPSNFSLASFGRRAASMPAPA